MRNYSWLRYLRSESEGKSYSVGLGDYLAHKYVEKHTLEEIKNTSYDEMARQMYEYMSQNGRKYIGRPFEDNLPFARQNKLEELVGMDTLLKDYAAFIEEHIGKHLEKYHGVCESERFYEDVPYENRQFAVRHGGKWDSDVGMWYFPSEEQRTSYNHSAP